MWEENVNSKKPHLQKPKKEPYFFAYELLLGLHLKDTLEPALLHWHKQLVLGPRGTLTTRHYRDMPSTGAITQLSASRRGTTLCHHQTGQGTPWSDAGASSESTEAIGSPTRCHVVQKKQ